MPNSNPITSDMRPTVDLNKFRFWCQKVLPLVYDDSISYYEVLGKMVVYLNQVIDNVNADSENVLTLKQAFDELVAYVDSVIQYDISDLEEAVATAVHAAELATEAETIVQGYAGDAESSKTAAQGSAESASESAASALQSAQSAESSKQLSSQYASQADQSAVSAGRDAMIATTKSLVATDSAKVAEGYAVGQQNGADVGSDSLYYHNNAKYYNEQSEAEALKAEGLAVGQQNGVDVTSESPYYHKNAKYYAEQAGQGAGAFPLSELPDTYIVNPENGQILKYDSTSEKWINSDDVEVVTSLDALTDTDLDTPEAGQVLMYDSASQKWVNSDENEIAISAIAPSNPDTKLWINETQSEPILLATSSELNAVKAQVNVISDEVEEKADISYVTGAIAAKADSPTIVTQSAPTAITLADNFEYYLTNVANLTLTFPSGNFECWLSIQTANNFTAFNLPASTMYIGDEPELSSGERWEISIKNGVVIAGEVA